MVEGAPRHAELVAALHAVLRTVLPRNACGRGIPDFSYPKFTMTCRTAV